MLRRGDSDFAWFRERAQSLHSDSLSAYTDKMVTTTASSSADNEGPGGLVSEPSKPQDRAAHSLPPKSYAQAVDTENKDQEFGDKGVNGSATNGDGKGLVNGHTAKTKKVDDDKVLYQAHKGQNGETPLTSIKPSEEYEKSLRHSAKTAPQKEVGPGKPKKRQDTTSTNTHPAANLASGRQAGAGWQTSA